MESYVSGYNMGQEKGVVESVTINENEKIPSDVLVLCLGPQARPHVKKHFKTVFPMITGQGYSVNLPDYDPE